MTYIVTENTPGYLPDDDDPATFDDLGEAREYAAELIDSYGEYIYEIVGLDEAEVEEAKSHARELPGDGSGVSVDFEQDEHSLGRHFAISPAEE
jgi:hypothetical protein